MKNAFFEDLKEYANYFAETGAFLSGLSQKHGKSNMPKEFAAMQKHLQSNIPGLKENRARKKIFYFAIISVQKARNFRISSWCAWTKRRFFNQQSR